MSMAITNNASAPTPTVAANPAPPKKGDTAAKAATATKTAPARGATATISAAALAAAKEAAETPAQTAQEAQGSDMQAKRLLARETAARKAYS
jgi:hypothetical protein